MADDLTTLLQSSNRGEGKEPKLGSGKLPFTLTPHSAATWKVDKPAEFATWLTQQEFSEVKAIPSHDREWRRFERGAEIVTISTGFIVAGAGRQAALARQWLGKVAAGAIS